jgi:hypothetical protein
MFRAIRKFFSKTTSYRFHLISGASIDVHDVLKLKIEWNKETQHLNSYHVTHSNPSSAKLFYLQVDSIIAIEEIK